MSILWCGGEDINFLLGSYPVTGTTAGTFNANYARCFVGLTGSPANRIVRSDLFPGGAIASGWFSCWLNTEAGADRMYFGLVNSASPHDGFYVGAGAVNGKLALYKYESSTKTRLASEAITSFNGLQKVDVYVEGIGASKNIKVYLEGTLLIDFTGDTTLGSVTDLNQIVLRNDGGAGSNYFSEIIVANEDTRALRLVTLIPNAAGDDLWVGGAYTDVDEIATSDADLAYTNTNDDDFSMNLSTIPTGTFRVRAVMESARVVMTGDSTPQGIALGVKSGGSYDYGTKQNLSTGWNTYQRLMTTNPVTTNEWTQAEIDALQINLRSKA